MRKLGCAIIALLLAGFLSASFEQPRAGILALLGAGKGSSGVACTGYTGPGDAVASAYAWGGLRAYSCATRGGVAINVCNVSDVACVDFSTNASTGALTITTVGGSDCAVVTCTIKTVYDQSGNNGCSGPCDFTQATTAKRPVLTTNCVSSLPCMSFTALGNIAASLVSISATPASIAQPFTITAAAIRSSGTTGFGLLVSDANFNGLRFFNGANLADLDITTSHSFSQTDATWHRIIGVFNVASSQGVIDGSSSSLTLGSAALDQGFNSKLDLFEHSSGTVITVKIVETGIWVSAFSAGQITSMDGNISSFWGI